MNEDIKVFKCPKCDAYLNRIYSVKEVEEMYPLKNMFDIANLKMRSEMNRYRVCPSCGHVEYLSVKELLKGLKTLGLGRKDFQEDLKGKLNDAT